MKRGEGNREKLSLSVGMNGFSSDLLEKLMKQSYDQYENEKEEDEEGLELSLGLSMNGRFGVDPVRKKLKRSSSISNLVFTVGAVDNGSSQQARVAEFDSYAQLPRTRSLPTEAEEEWRRRKEFQSMRRMEARKKRMEKLRNVRVQKDKENSVEIGNGLHEVVSKNVCGQRIDDGIVNKFENGNEISSSQGSFGSQRSGSGSSGISDLDFEGGNQKADFPPPPASQPSRDQSEQEPASRAADRDAKLANNYSLKNAMFDMPYVSTKGDGPNGHKIEGFLYRYKKGEEVRIVCVCHGLFLTPAEFIKHGGGGDVEHPLKHIVVNPFPLV